MSCLVSVFPSASYSYSRQFHDLCILNEEKKNRSYIRTYISYEKKTVTNLGLASM